MLDGRVIAGVGLVLGEFMNFMTGVKENDATELVNGRWWIKSGFAGYNCPANNGFGFATKADAEAAIRRYEKRV
jgi:hypothetical protein